MKVEKKVVVPVPPPAEYTITLTEVEASQLMAVFGCFCGERGPALAERVLTDTLYDAMWRVGLRGSRSLNPVSLKATEKL